MTKFFAILLFAAAPMCHPISDKQSASLTQIPPPERETVAPPRSQADTDTAVQPDMTGTRTPESTTVEIPTPNIDPTRPKKCPSPNDESIELHIYVKSTVQTDIEKLVPMLQKDGFLVSFIDTRQAPPGHAVVAIQAPPQLYRRIFGVKLENRRSPMSARSGYRCQLQVTHTVIPKRYRTLVESIAPPDPQLY